MVFPSSHCSVPRLNPSPQVVEQVPFIFGKTHPPQSQLTLQFSFIHVAEHPSFAIVFPSSHCYVPAMIPSPQIVEQVPFTTGVV